MKGLHDAMKTYKNTVFHIKEIHFDNESNKSIETLQEMYNYTFTVIIVIHKNTYRVQNETIEQ